MHLGKKVAGLTPFILIGAINTHSLLEGLFIITAWGIALYYLYKIS